MKVKYPSSPHVPWSPGVSGDDVILANTEPFSGKEVVVTEKMDGENTTMYGDHIHARSLDSRHHPSRDWVKHLHGQIRHNIPEGYRICGENVYARHSIQYENLDSYFYLFSVWDERNHALDWDATLEWAALLGLQTPQEFYRGPWDVEAIQKLDLDTDLVEGFVVRTVEGFAFGDFRHHLAKWVRKNHVQTDQHWMHAQVIPNGLKGES